MIYNAWFCILITIVLFLAMGLMSTKDKLLEVVGLLLGLTAVVITFLAMITP